jgi:hypothetical protein
VDSACTGASVISEAQYMAYCTDFNVPMETDRGESRRIVFGEEKLWSPGIAGLKVPIGDVVEDIAFYVVKGGNSPALLSLTDLDRLRIDLRTLTRELVRDGKSTPLTFDQRYGLLFLRWSKTSCFFTQEELHKLHRNFGHRSVQQLSQILSRQGLKNRIRKQRNVCKK